MKKRVVSLLLAMLLMFINTLSVNAALPNDKLYVYYLSTGNSDCTLIGLNGKYMLVDTTYDPSVNADHIAMVKTFLRKKT